MKCRRVYIIAQLILLINLLTLHGCSGNNPASEKWEIAVPKGWYLSLNNSQVNLLKAKEKKNSYSLFLDRTENIEDANYYIHIAESIYPDRNKIQTLTHLETNHWYFERLWWFEEYKNMLIPYAITGDTVNFYIEKYKQRKEKIKNKETKNEWKGSNKNRIEFSYTANIVEEGTYTDDNGNQQQKIRVIMQIRWYEYCGQPCGWGFEKRRDIVFMGKNRVVQVIGDGIISKWISTHQQPYAPEQWIKY